MSEEARFYPTPAGGRIERAMQRMLDAHRIAIVGASDNPSRASYSIASYLRQAGYEVVPVNPNHQTVLDVTCYPTLADVPGEIEVVNVFRRPEFCGKVAREAIQSGARGIWLQSGIFSEEARMRADKAGIDFVENRCIMIEHMRRQ